MASEDDTEDEEPESKTSETRVNVNFQPNNIFQIMNSYAREFIFILAIAFTAIAALQNGPLKSRKANPPKLFFEPPSLITDFFQGDYSRLSSLVLSKDVSVVLYYAPWDAKSMHFRQEFETVAKYYYQEIFFAAINCWWPEGECSQKHKIYAYPVIIVFIHDAGNIHYEGPFVASYIIKFLDHILSPITALWQTSDLIHLTTKHEGVVVGYFNFRISREPEGFREFYITSLRVLTKDPQRKIAFAVVTNPSVASKFNLKLPLTFFLWNQTVNFDPEKNWDPKNIITWIESHLNTVLQWITPSGSKSKTLSNIIEKFPTLIMFTPRNLLFESVPYYDLLREVALEYKNCNASAEITSLVHHIVLKRHILQEDFTKLIERCQLEDSHDICGENNSKSCDLTCCRLHNMKIMSKSLSCICQICLHHQVESVSKMKLTECENILDLILKGISPSTFNIHDQCQDIEMSYPTKFGLYNKLSLKCHNEREKQHVQYHKKIIPDLSLAKDDRILAMWKKSEKLPCKRLKFALNYSKLNFPEFPTISDIPWQSNFTGLSCQTNRTLTFILMDTVLFHSFAEKLGIDILTRHHKTAAIIVEASHESTYLLEEPINKRTLIEFVKNYNSRTLNRFLRSTVSRTQGCSPQTGNICVKELTTSTFSDYVLKNDTDVILMYYAAWCGACSSVFHIFLAVANYFANIGKVKFARISGEDHDLPWEYTVEKYPTIIFFPAFRKEDSVEFPSRLSITKTNLLHFILANVQPSVRLHMSMQMCNRECIAHNLARSGTEVLRLFRDYKILLNQYCYVRQLDKYKHDKFKTKFSLYTQNLISRIRSKRSKIQQAYNLKHLLQEKRNRYLKVHQKIPLFTTTEPSVNQNLDKISVTLLNKDSKLKNSKLLKDEF